MNLINKKIFNEKFCKVIEQLEQCYSWLENYRADIKKGWDPVFDFQYLRSSTQRLIYLFSDLFKQYSTEDEKTQALDEDLKNFVTFMLSSELARALNEPEDRKGEISNAVAQIETFLSYVGTVLENTAKDIEEEVPQKFIEHSLRNVGLVPKFEKLKEIEKSAGMVK